MLLGWELAAQGLVLILAMAAGLGLFFLPRAGLAAMRRRGRATVLARRPFILGAQHLARARAAPAGSPQATHHARLALEEADRAAAADPRDAAAHVLRAAALEIRGRRAAAIRALDSALAPPAARSLPPKERGNALLKRAELHLAGGEKGRRRRRTIDAVVDDLLKALKDDPSNGRAFCLLGECYEEVGMSEEAGKAYRSAAAIDDGNYSVKAREAVRRMGVALPGD